MVLVRECVIEAVRVGEEDAVKEFEHVSDSDAVCENEGDSVMDADKDNV